MEGIKRRQIRLCARRGRGYQNRVSLEDAPLQAQKTLRALSGFVPIFCATSLFLKKSLQGVERIQSESLEMTLRSVRIGVVIAAFQGAFCRTLCLGLSGAGFSRGKSTRSSKLPCSARKLFFAIHPVFTSPLPVFQVSY